MAIRDEIEARLKQARRDRDERTKNVIAMVKNKVLMELKSGSGRAEDDALWMEVLAAYAKQLRKALPELRKAGDRGIEASEETEFELAFCEGFLPQKLDEAGTEALVRKVAAEHGIADSTALGKLMGILMKEHRDTLDGQLARAVASRVLAG
jgi:uncharacterized protein